MTQTGDALTNRAYALAMQYGGETNYEGFRTLDAEWDFISAALPRLLTGDNDRLQSVCHRLVLSSTSLEDGMNGYGSLNKPKRAPSPLTTKGAQAGGHTTRDTLTTFATNPPKGWRAPPDPLNIGRTPIASLKAAAIELRGTGHRLQEDYPAAIAAYCEALELFRSISPESHNVAAGLNSLAEAERENKDYPAAERDYREALRIAKIVKYEEGVATITGNLAGLALDREQWAETESLAREALTLAEKSRAAAIDCQQLSPHRQSPAQTKSGRANWQFAPTRSLIPIPPRRRDFHAPAYAG